MVINDTIGEFPTELPAANFTRSLLQACLLEHNALNVTAMADGGAALLALATARKHNRLTQMLLDAGAPLMPPTDVALEGPSILYALLENSMFVLDLALKAVRAVAPSPGDHRNDLHNLFQSAQARGDAAVAAAIWRLANTTTPARGGHVVSAADCRAAAIEGSMRIMMAVITAARSRGAAGTRELVAAASAVDALGRNAAHAAASAGNTGALRALMRALPRRAAVSIASAADYMGVTPVDDACAGGHIAAAALLRTWGGRKSADNVIVESTDGNDEDDEFDDDEVARLKASGCVDARSDHELRSILKLPAVSSARAPLPVSRSTDAGGWSTNATAAPGVRAALDAFNALDDSCGVLDFTNADVAPDMFVAAARRGIPLIIRGFTPAALTAAWTAANLVGVAGSVRVKATTIPYQTELDYGDALRGGQLAALNVTLADFAAAVTRCPNPFDDDAVATAGKPTAAVDSALASLCNRFAEHAIAAAQSSSGVAAGHGGLPFYVFAAPTDVDTAPVASVEAAPTPALPGEPAAGVVAGPLVWVGPSAALSLLAPVDPVPPLLRGTVPVRRGGAMTQLPLVVGSPKPQFYLGAPGSGAPTHFHKDAVNICVHGTKSWLLSPPAASEYGTMPAAPYAARRLGAHNATNAGKSSSKKKSTRDRTTPYSTVLTDIRCTQHAGDAIFVPANWGHVTINREVTIGVALEFDTVFTAPWSAATMARK